MQQDVGIAEQQKVEKQRRDDSIKQIRWRHSYGKKFF